MANGASNTYTTYLRTELDPATRQSYSQLRTLAEATYRDIGRLAQEASNTTAAALGDKRSTNGFRNLELSAASSFGSIRRQAADTSTSISAMQARLASIRTTALANVIPAGSTGTAARNNGASAAAGANDNLAASNRRVAATSVAVTSAQARQAASTAAMGGEATKLSRGLTVLGTTLSVVQGPLGPIAGRINAITSAVTTLGTGTLVLAGAATALFAFAGVANVYAEVESRLKPLYSSQDQVNGALRETGRIALATRSALAPTADLYAKLTAAGRDFNISQRQVARVTETAAKAATLSGGNAATREAGLYQFSQGLASNKLGGDELRSILENIPELARAIAQGFQNADGSIGVTTGELRKLGAEGKLTATVIADALTRSADAIDVKFSKLPKTIGSARTEFVTAFTLLTGKVDQTVGVTSTLANVISVAAQNLQVLLALGGAFAARFTLPKLTGFIAELTAARNLKRDIAAQTTATSAARGADAVTLLTPRGIAQAKVDTAAQTRAVAQERLAAEQQVIAAIDAEIAKTVEAAEADRAKGAQAVVNARAEVIAIDMRVAALQAELAVRNEAKAAAALNVQTFASAAPLVNRPLADGEQESARSARITAFTEQQTAAKLELAQADVRAAGTARALAAAQGEQQVAMQASTAATVTAAEAEIAAAARGPVLIGLGQQRAAVNGVITATTLEVAAADTALAAAEVRLSAAQVAYNAVASAGTAVMGGLSAAAKGLSAAVGGPLVLALTVAAGALIYLAGQSEAALDSLHNFSGGQDELYKRLGITTDKLREQADAYRDIALAAAKAGVADARQQRTAANRDLGGSLATVAQRVGYADNIGPNDRKAIFDKLNTMSDALRNGQVLSPSGAQFISQLYAKRPDVFQDTGLQGGIDRFLGKGAGKVVGGKESKIGGVLAADVTLNDAITNLNRTTDELAKPRVERKTVAPLTPEQILAQGTAQADSISTKRALLKSKFDEQISSIQSNPQYDDQRKIQEIAQATAQYNLQTAAIDKRDAAAAKAISAKAAREAAKAAREEEAATRRAASATEKLNDLRSKYDDQPKLVDTIENDKRAFDRLIGQQINVVGPDGNVELDSKGKQKRREYTATDAMLDRQNADAALNKPFNDITRDMERQLQIQTLTLQGRDAEADALQRSFQLVDRTGIIQAGQYQTLVSLADAQNTINAALEERGRIVSTLRGTVDSLRDSVTQFLDDLPNKAAKVGSQITGKDGETRRYGTLDFAKDTLGGLGGSVLSGFQQAKNKLGVDGLFSGLQKKIDDMISGRTGLVNATDFAADQTKKTGTAVQRFGNVVDGVSDKLEQTLQNMNGGVGAAPGPIGASGLTSPFAEAGNLAGLGGGSILLTAAGLASEVGELGDRLAGRSTDRSAALADMNAEPEPQDIVVTAKRKQVQEAQQPVDRKKQLSVREIYNAEGQALGEKLDKALGTKFLGGLGSKLGDALNGASRGAFASNIASAIGLKQSATGAKIGGAIGSFVPIPFGAEIGGLIGGTLGGLFKKAKVGSAGITTDQFGQLAATAGKGTNAKAVQGAVGLAGSVSDGLQQIADQLGAKITGTSNVQIGTYKDQIRVSTNGTPIGGKGSSGAITFKDEQEAVQYAIRDAISDGVLTGISEASQRILKSGQDLNKAIQKALLIESIPKRLLAATDPVRAAVNDLNDQYSQLIAALNEGKASAQQYADAQKLYDIDRAKTIADASKAATSAIDDYLKGMLSGSSSPLNKATVYQNATSDLNQAKSDFASGKIDDQALVAAAGKFQDASRAFNGSNSSFFNDFDMLTKLLTDAKASKSVPGVSTNGDLPGSPFANDSGVQAALAASSSAAVKATQDQTAVLAAKLDVVAAGLANLAGGGGGSNDKGYSSLDSLAAFRS
jgi:tape measure domain-containing protein